MPSTLRFWRGLLAADRPPFTTDYYGLLRKRRATEFRSWTPLLMSLLAMIGSPAPFIPLPLDRRRVSRCPVDPRPAGYGLAMPANRPISRVLDEHRFDVLASSAASELPHAAVMVLDRDLRIRGVNAAYEVISMRRRDEMLGEFVFEVFPDDPSDPQASGTSRLAMSIESAIRSHGTDTMPIYRYDITYPRDRHVFVPKVWRCNNTALDDGHEQIVLHDVAEIASLDDGLATLSQYIDGLELPGAAEQLHVLSALTAEVRAERDRARAMTQEIEQLHRAVETRDMIGQAKGMLMERFGIDAQAAFALLVRMSQTTNTPLAEIAQKFLEIYCPGG